MLAGGTMPSSCFSSCLRWNTPSYLFWAGRQGEPQSVDVARTSSSRSVRRSRTGPAARGGPGIEPIEHSFVARWTSSMTATVGFQQRFADAEHRT